MSSPPSDTPERNYPLIKIVAGDYLLPGNDARTLWRIRRYEEELVAADDSIEVRPCWGAWRWTSRLDSEGAVDDLNVEDWNQWEYWGGLYDTRAEAIAEALRAER